MEKISMISPPKDANSMCGSGVSFTPRTQIFCTSFATVFGGEAPWHRICININIMRTLPHLIAFCLLSAPFWASDESDVPCTRLLKNMVENSALRFLNATNRRAVEVETKRRENILKSLALRFGSDASRGHKLIFKRQEQVISAEMRPYGIYFAKQLQNIHDWGSTALRGVNPKLDQMVGEGHSSSKEHEFQHMFDTMVPRISTNLNKLQKLDLKLGPKTEKEEITLFLKSYYLLWANSILAMEFSARIDDEDILLQRPEPLDQGTDCAFGGASLFSLYQLPLFTPEKFSGVSEHRRESLQNHLWAAHGRESQYWRKIYNQNLVAVQNSLRSGVPKGKIKALLLEIDFENLPTVFPDLGAQ